MLPFTSDLHSVSHVLEAPERLIHLRQEMRVARKSSTRESGDLSDRIAVEEACSDQVDSATAPLRALVSVRFAFSPVQPPARRLTPSHKDTVHDPC